LLLRHADWGWSQPCLPSSHSGLLPELLCFLGFLWSLEMLLLLLERLQ
jgi:hypothetical protein